MRWIAPHLVLQAGVDQVGHGALLRVAASAPGSVAKARAGRVKIFGIHMPHDGGDLRQSAAASARSAARCTSSSTSCFQPVDGRWRRECPRAAGASAAWRDGSRSGSACAPPPMRYSALVVGKRVRVRPHDMPVDKRRAVARAAIGHGLDHRSVACDGVGAVHLGKMEVGEIRHQPRDVAARRVHLHRRRDGVPVVFDDKQHRQLAHCEAVFSASQNSPWLVDAFAERDIDHLVAVELTSLNAR